MSDELKFPIQTGDEEAANQVDIEEYEEITSEEVDRVVEALDELAESTTSLNIRAFLEEAAANIFTLVYDEDELEDAA
ncbi:MAG: hypothetical protein R3B90_16415 [Planctomycetaceae bacterium]